MDFVVVGFGFGALSVLLGLLLRDLVPWWFRVPLGRPLPERVVRRRVAHGRLGRAGGAVLAIVGSLLGLVALITLLLNAGDRTGLEVVFTALAAALLAILGWTFVYVQRFHGRPRGYRAEASSRRRASDRPDVQDVPSPPSEVGSRWAAFEARAATTGDSWRRDRAAWSGPAAVDPAAESRPDAAGAVQDSASDAEPDAESMAAVLDGAGSDGGVDAAPQPKRPRRDTPLRVNASGG